MSPLNTGAAAQAERDAGAKIIRSAERRSPLRWLLAQRLRTQFLVVIATLFVAYAAVSVILVATGLRPAAQPPVAAKKAKRICADPGMSVTERAKCIADHDPPVVIQRPGTEAKIKTEKVSHAATSPERQMAMQKELARLRDAKRYQALREDFERRMAEMISGELKLPDYPSRKAYFEDTIVVVAEMLQLSDHPMKLSRGQPLSGDFYPDRNAAATPLGGDDAERRVKGICGEIGSERLRACATALRDQVFQLRYAVSKDLLFRLAFSARQ